ncbi:ABC transporter ATP-binding protein [Terrabacter aerolatus]|uniref:ABC transporter ATP-binding protein n=1 Tax=Terrabacter aerolatus TaxID=422442 RepID=A0A512D0H7_9MICO|nr:ABC transporter ATP-binding protein [Terrabacter aerolatus]GEO29968.1 ABC transporter ATP-binding protein [Terrabacter aerolatus]
MTPPGLRRDGLDARVRLSRGAIEVDVALTAEPGQVIGILGPNGGGKTSTVLALAGVLPLAAGHVEVGGRLWDDGRRRLAPEQRQVGLMLADSLLFPHLRALDNVAFGPRSRGVPRQQARQRARAELERVGLADRESARPGELSSGQQARVALARALATDPALLLLDEPLAALDPDTRARTRSDLAARLAAYDGVTVLVTHDPLDALTLADHLVFVEDGKVSQTGTPADVLSEPRSAYVGTVVGLNLYAGQGDSHGHVRTADGGLIVTTSPTEGPVWATVPPSAVSLHLHEPEGSPRNAWRLRISAVTMQGQSARVGLVGGVPLTAEVTLESVTALGLQVGHDVWAAVKATEVRTYPR